MKRRTVALAIFLLLLPRIAAAAVEPPDIPGHGTQLSIYLAKGPANACGQGCDHWIAVEGKVDSGAAARVRQFFRRVKDTSLPIYFYSPGGDVGQALAIGRMLRARKAIARIGRTTVNACTAANSQIGKACLKIKAGTGEIDASLIAHNAMCNSACVYIFLGATTRDVAPDTGLGVHNSRITLRFSGHPTEFQREQAMARSRDRSDRERASFVQAMGISSEFVDLVKTVKFESSHVLTRQELYRFGIDKREFAETSWMMEAKARPFVRKFAWVKKDDGTFRAMEWRLFCEGKDRARLMFIREFDKNAGNSMIAMIAGTDKPLTFGALPARQGNYDVWSAVIKRDAVKDLFAQSRLQVGESTFKPDGKTTDKLFDIETLGLEGAWTQLSAACAASPAPVATPAAAAASPIPATVPDH